MPWGEENLPKPQPLNITIKHHSDTLGISINPYYAPVPANGKIVAIRIQDIARDLWFNYDRGTWDGVPEVTPGANLYIAAYAENIGANGDMMLQIRAESAVIVGKTEYVPSGGSLGVESGTINMPDRVYSVIISVVP